MAEEVRSLALDDERAARNQRRLLNHLCQDLLEVFPQALATFPDLEAPTALAFLAHWPSAYAARQASAVELDTFFGAQRHGSPARAAARVRAALAAEALVAPAHLARAKAGTIRLLAEQLLLLHRQRAAWERLLRGLLERAYPDGETLLSLPGLDARLAARVWGEVGDRRERFPTLASLQCHARTAPATRRSGKLCLLSGRLAGNRPLRQACLQWAFCSLGRSAWARAFYDAQRAASKTHYKALRALATRWLELLHHLLGTGQCCDEAVHQRNRFKASLPQAAWGRGAGRHPQGHNGARSARFDAPAGAQPPSSPEKGWQAVSHGSPSHPEVAVGELRVAHDRGAVALGHGMPLVEEDHPIRHGGHGIAVVFNEADSAALCRQAAHQAEQPLHRARVQPGGRLV